MNVQRILHLLFIVLLAVEVSGCMTVALLDGKTHYGDKTQEWKITEDVSHLVIVGEQQTYFFDLQEPLKTVFQSSYRDKLRLGIGKLSLDKNGQVTAPYAIRLDSRASLQERKAASADGLRCDSKNYVLKGDLAGKRYVEYPVIGGFSLEGIRKEDELKVGEDEERGTMENVVRYALVPIAIVADIVLGVALLSLIIVMGPGSGPSRCR